MRAVGRKVKCSWSGTYTSRDGVLEAEFKAYGYGWYRPQTWEEPEEDEIYCEDVEFISVKNKESEQEVTLSDEGKEHLEGEIIDACEGGEFEPDFDNADNRW